MKKLKSVVAASLAIFLFLIVSTSVFAAPKAIDAATKASIEATPDSIPDRIPAEMLTGKNKITITNKQKLKAIAVKEKLDKIPVKIEYEYVPAEAGVTAQSSSQPTAFATTASYWADTVDYGSGWHYGTPYKTFRVDGPDTFVYEESVKYYNSWNGTFGMSVSALNASIGFVNGQERTVKFISNTPVISTQTLYVELYETYHKVWYGVYSGPTGDKTQSLCCGSGYAWEANGTWIKKTFYNK